MVALLESLKESMAMEDLGIDSDERTLSNLIEFSRWSNEDSKTPWPARS